MSTTRTYTSQELPWCVDNGQILVFDVRNGVVHRLSGYPAILWEWLTSCSDITRLIDQTSELLKYPEEQASSLLQNTLESWHEAGLLTVEN